VAAAILAFVPQTMHAQSNALHVNLAAGATIPTGQFSDRNDVGYHLTGGVIVKQPGMALGFRAEGMYNGFNEKITNDNSHAGVITVNATYDLLTNSRSNTSGSLYLIGGVGYYSTSEPSFESESRTNVGWNIGGGFQFPLTGFSAYIETRYHYVSNTDVRFVPITFGVVF
jgi:opacity protein-like surface antigen